MIKIFLCLQFFSSFFLFSSAQKKQFDEKKLQLKWQLVENSYKGGEQTLAAFTLINNSSISFPSSHWTIYFNSSREIVANSTITGGAYIAHVNGDIYKLSPASDFGVLRAKDSVRIEYLSNGQLLNYTAAPRGLYIVWNNGSKGYILPEISIEPFKNTASGFVTPEKIYEQNSIIKDIPVAGLSNVFPTPLNYKETGSEFLLKAGVSIQTNPLFKSEADYLSRELELMFGNVFPVLADNVNEKKILLQKGEMKNEAYQLSVTPEGIIITASSGAGIFYGIQSLRSLMPATSWNGKQPAVRIPTVEIEDAPRFGYRSLMLDVARNFKSTTEILRILDLMALYKMNVFHFHFSDDEGWRIQISSLPELTDIGAKRGHTLDSKLMLPASYGSGPIAGKTLASGYYTKNDFIKILRYANERHIQVIPEIESPGHSRAAIKAMDARYERFIQQGDKTEAERYLLRDVNDQSVYSSAQQWTDNVMCVALPSVYTFIDKVIEEFISMYKEANVPLTTIHLGGDEVPAGAWEKSPLCRQLIYTGSAVKETNDLWYYYFKRINQLLQSKGLLLSGWEEVGMRNTLLDGSKVMIVNPRFANDNIQLHVWNNMVGWGAEDLPYRLANAGYKVVLSPVSNNYFDLAYYKYPDEPGYYWGGFADIDKPFSFIPFDYYKTTKEDAAGNPVQASYFADKARLTDFGKSNIAGIQGLMWGENLRSDDELYYLLLPKLLGVAERAWAKDPEWALAKDTTAFEQLYNGAWSVFVNVIGKRELPRLDYLCGGFKYRIPTPGAVVKNGKVMMNIQFPGLIIRYTTDGTDPDIQSKIYNEPVVDKGRIKMKAFNSTGRYSRTIAIENK